MTKIKFKLSLLHLFGFILPALISILFITPNASLAQRKKTKAVETSGNSQGGVNYNPNKEQLERGKLKTPIQFFNAAKGKFREEKFAQAEELFTRYLQKIAGEPQSRIEAGKLFYEKSLIEQAKYEQASKACNQIYFSSAGDAARRESQFDLSIIYARQLQYESAAKQLVELIGTPFSPLDKLRAKALLYLRVLAATRLTPTELRTLYSFSKSKNHDLSALFFLESSQRLFGKDSTDFDLLSNEIQAFLSENPSVSAYYKTALQNLKNKCSQAKSVGFFKLKYALVLPVKLEVFDSEAPEARSIGVQILEGILHATTSANLNPLNGSRHISLHFQNELLDSTRLLSGLNELIQNEHISLVIGPIFSEKARLISKFLSSKGIPMITPTATDESISKNSTFAFQINPTYRMRGSIIADYLIREQKADTVIIFAQDSTYGKEMAEGFRETMLKNKKIVKFYALLSPNFTSLKKAIEPLRIEFKEETGYAPTSSQFIYLPMTTLEAAGIAASQLKVFNFTGKFVGSGDWFNPSKLQLYKDLVDSVFFAIDSDVQPDHPLVRSTAETYRNYWRMPIDAMFWRGYDTIDYLTQVTSAKNSITPSDFVSLLKAAPPFRGVHTEVYFQGGSVNSRMNIMRYLGGKIKRVN
ncbi:MAG: ABC transporter substrate-binding protein [Chloroherpetonaceae bacterium]|nr:ABC transporter substrate-binding protein [Chloroherpetonaceae bacterium]